LRTKGLGATCGANEVMVGLKSFKGEGLLMGFGPEEQEEADDNEDCG